MRAGVRGAAAFGCTQLRDDAFSHVVMRLMVRLLILHTDQ